MCEVCGKPWAQHESLMRGLADVKAGRVEPLGSFAQYIDEEPKAQ